MADDSGKRQMKMNLEKYYQEYKSLSTSLEKDLSDCVNELYTIADDVDTFHKRATIGNVVGSAVGIAGGITTIVGIALAPVTFGASLICSIVGISVATAGGVTGVSASIADAANTKKKCNMVNEKIENINKNINLLEELSSNIEEFATNIITTVSVPFAKQYPDCVRMGGKGVFVAVEFGRLAQLGRIPTAAARGAQIAAQGARAIQAVSGVFSVLFVAVDAAFLVKGSVDLHRGAKTKTAEEMRELADELLGTLNDLKKTSENLLDEIKKATELI